MLKTVRIRKHEVGLLFRSGDFQCVLTAGTHRLWGLDVLLGRLRVEVYNRLEPKFTHPLLDVLISNEQLRGQLLLVDLSDVERALVWKDGRLGWVLGPGRYAFWNSPASLEVETFDVGQFHFQHPKVEAVLGFAGAGKYLDGVRVEPHERVLLFREGEHVETLGPGMYVYWKHAGKIVWKSVDVREQTLDVAGQEIMTADKVTLRVNLLVVFQVVDAVKALTAVTDYQQTLYRDAQLVLRSAIGTRQLEQLLADKQAIGSELRDGLVNRAQQLGVEVQSVGVRDIVLPGDMKNLMNQVIEAQKQAEANLIRRREETAAARSQVNTARLLADNPVLTRMKELEALAEILAGAKTTFVFGQGDLSEQIRGLTAQPGRE